MNQLAAVAVTRLQGELAKDGTEAPAAFADKSFPAKPSLMKSNGKTKGENVGFLSLLLRQTVSIYNLTVFVFVEKNALAQFCVDLTARANEGLVDPVIGREKEVQRIIQVLCRRTKNNPILLGQSGVGKTAIVEGLATRISQLDVPAFLLVSCLIYLKFTFFYGLICARVENATHFRTLFCHVFLQSKRVMSLDVALLMAGAKERGELEKRVTTLLTEVQKAGEHRIRNRMFVLEYNL